MRCIVYSPHWLWTILSLIVKSAFYIRTQAWGFRRCSFRQLGRCQSLYCVERVTGLAPRFHVYILTFCKTSQHGSHWQKNICNMAISSIEHRSGWYDIFDARGKKAKTISHNIGELLGWSDRFFIVRRSGWYDTYDEQGNKIKTISTNIGNFVSICADQFIVRRSAWLDTYDAWGKKISTRAAR